MRYEIRNSDNAGENSLTVTWDNMFPPYRSDVLYRNISIFFYWFYGNLIKYIFPKVLLLVQVRKKYQMHK